MYYEIKLKTKLENGKERTEHYITDVELFGEAEMKGMEQCENDCDVFAIFRSKVKEIVNQKEEGKPFYKATITCDFTDEDGTEKEQKYFALVCAKDVTEANKIMSEYLQQGYNMFLDGIVKTKILDLI